jgi:hypothetical protein
MNRPELDAGQGELDEPPTCPDPAPDCVVESVVEPEPSDSRSRVADKRWVKPLSSYERKETTVVEGLRYG